MRDITLKDAEEALEIDKNDLDTENVRLPQLMYEITTAHARAKGALVRTEREKVTKSAEVEDQLRKTEIGKKYTVDAMKSTVRLNPTVRDLNDEIIDLQETVDRWAGAVMAIQQKSRSVKELGELHRVNYYTSEATSVRDARSNIADQNREAAGQLRRGRVTRENG